MQLLASTLLASFLIGSVNYTYTQEAIIDCDIYKKELLAFTENPNYQGIFDLKIIVTENNEYKPISNAKISSSLVSIQQDINNYAATSLLERLTRLIIFALDVIVVTPENMPKLHAYVTEICKNQSMKAPMIFISRKCNFFKAFAKKLFWGRGNILIGQSIILETSDAALEAVIAHELGHIKHNHINKMIAINIASTLMSQYALKILLQRNLNTIESLAVNWLLKSIISNKRFEKEADEFAYKTLNKGDGLIEFLEILDKKDADYEQGFYHTYDLLQKNKNALGTINYLILASRYYATRAIDYTAKAYKWIYHNTFYGAHPSNQARMQAIRDYQASIKQEAIAS